MDNFFNYISKQLKQEDIEIWFNINNIIPEKMELYYDFSISIHKLILETYLGDDDGFNETKVSMTEEDKNKHFDWCWDKTIDSFNLENISTSLLSIGNFFINSNVANCLRCQTIS